MTTEGDNPLGAEPLRLEDALRAALTQIPEELGAAGSLPVAMLEEIDRAIDDGWPLGRPMTVEELAADSSDSPAGHWHDGVTQYHGWADPATGEFAEPDHLHGGPHQDDHSSHNDPDHGLHL